MYLEMDLLVLMLENYKRLYIEDMRKRGIKEEIIQNVVHSDIDRAIAWADSRAIAEAEIAEQFE